MITFYHDIEQNYDSRADIIECRKMVYEFLRLEKKYNIPATYNIVGKLFIEQPDLIDSILDEGQDIAFHSFNHQTDWKPEYYSNEIALCRKVSSIPKGYRSPRSQITQDAVKSIWDEGFLWSAESDKHSEPYYIYKDLVRLPITADDWPLYEGKVTPKEWVQKFSKLIESHTYVAFGLHDFVASFDPGEIIKAWERVLQIAVESQALLVTFSEAADLYKRALVSKYPRSKKNKSGTNKPSLGHSFEKTVTKELIKLNNNVIAFICHGHEEIPFYIKEIAKENRHTIIKSNNIFDDESYCCFILSKEEILNSKLKLNSADLIICDNTMEYQYRSNHLTDCIKKLGKIGATYIAAFQNTEVNIDSLDETIPEITKRHLSLEQIKRWSNQIGPANLFIVDDEIPDNNENKNSSEDKFSEQINIPGKYIKGCILIGKVQYINGIQQKKRLHSLSDVTFRFPSPNLENFRIILEGKKIFFLKPIKKAVKMIQNLK